MSDRYAVATGNWNATAVWSAISGGSPGASVPGSGDDAYLDAASGAITVTIPAGTHNCRSLDCTGYTGTLDSGGVNRTLSVYGSLTLASGMTLATTVTFDHKATMAGKSVTTAGKTIRGLIFSGAGGGWSLQGAVTLTAALNVTAGALDANEMSISCGGLASTGTNTRSLDISNCSITLTNSSGGQSLNFTTTGLTLNCAGATLTCTSWNHVMALGGADFSAAAYLQTTTQYGTTAPQLSDDGSQLSELRVNHLGGQIYISGNNIEIGTLKKVAGKPKFLFDAGDTLKVGTVDCNGTAGNLCVVDLVSGSGQHTWEKIGAGVFSVDYWDIQDSVGSPGSTFYAGTHSTDGGNNSGWTFTDPSELTAVTSDLDIRQQILNAITGELDARWALLNSVNNDLQAVWNSLANVTGDLDTRLSVVQNINADLDLRWGVREAIAAELALHWDLLQHVTGDLEARWDITNLVVQELEARWDIRNKLESDLDLRWDSVAIAENSLTLIWSLEGYVITPIVLLRVPSELRTQSVPAELRTHATPIETRTQPVPWERRQLPVPAEQRVLTVHH